MNQSMQRPTIILVGKTNVGKSSLFNRLSDKRISIAHKTPGATRDCLIREADFCGHKVLLVDSGGIEEGASDSHFQDLISQQVSDFVKYRASLILFVLSAKDGIGFADHEVAHMLMRSDKPVIPIINKVDHENSQEQAWDCLQFGFKDPIMVSAAQKTGLMEIKARVLKELGIDNIPMGDQDRAPLKLLTEPGDADSELLAQEPMVNICVVGKPNSGKSTFINALLNEKRVLVSDRPGTTVDAVDTELLYGGRQICLVDTAGIRRQRSIHEEVEKMAVARSLCAMDRAQVAVLMISAREGVSEQDQKVAGMIFEKKKPCIIAVNKWDGDLKKEGSKEKFLEDIRYELPFLSHVPVLFLSAKYGHKIFDVLERSLILADRSQSRINTSKLNRSLEKAQVRHPPPVVMGRRIKMYFATQVESAPPTFAISCSRPHDVHFSYKRYLINFFRDELSLGEMPIRLIFRKKSEQMKIVR